MTEPVREQWYMTGPNGSDPDQQWQVCSPGGCHVANMDKERAALIVKGANFHTELVAALREVYAYAACDRPGVWHRVISLLKRIEE